MAFLTAKHLPTHRILLGRRIQTEAGLFALTSRCLAAGCPPGFATRLHDRLVRRHARRPVTLGGGLALPHAAVPGLTSPRAAFIRTEAPVPIAAADPEGVTDILALAVPSPGLAADYDLLMDLTAWLNRPATRAALHRARTAAALQALFTNCAGP